MLELIHTEEGRIVKSGGNYLYEYLLKDHLGNNRVGFRQGEAGTASFATDYYPFGLQYQARIRQSSPKNNYLYNGKELQESLMFFDYGARFYDPVIGRWNVIDRFAEKYHSWAPYQYTLNTPINAIDINGDSTKRVGWNRTVEEFNDNFRTGVQDRIDNPLLMIGDANDIAGEILGTVADFTVNLFGKSNPTRDAIEGGINTLGDIPNMSDEQLGALAAKAAILGINIIGQKKVPVVKTGLPVAEQAAALSQKIGKNSITLGTATKQIRFDLVGRAHGNIPTPHMQIYNKNFVNGIQKNISRASKEAVPMTQQEIRMIRRYIEKLDN